MPSAPRVTTLKGGYKTKKADDAFKYHPLCLFY